MTIPRATRKSKIVDDRRTTAITASANGDAFDMRGMEYVAIHLHGITVDQATDETYDCKLQHRHKSGDPWTDVPSMAFTQQDTLTAYNETMPTAATKDGISLMRWGRIVHTLAGTTPSFAGYVEMSYERTKSGPQVDHGSIS